MGTEIEKRGVGHPLKFKSARELEKKGLVYFRECKKRKEQITITGLALALGTNRQTLCNYEENEGHPEYVDAIKKLKATVEHAYELSMWKANNPAAGVFALKNMGWTDRTDLDITAKLRPSAYTEEEEAELRELARLRALKAITPGSGE